MNMEIFLSYFIVSLTMILTAGYNHHIRHLNETDDEKPVLLIAGAQNIWVISSFTGVPRRVVDKLEANFDIDFDYANKKLFYLDYGIFR